MGIHSELEVVICTEGKRWLCATVAVALEKDTLTCVGIRGGEDR